GLELSPHDTTLAARSDLRRGSVRMQHRGDLDAAVVALPIFYYRNDRPTDGDRGSVQRVGEARRGVIRRAVAGIQATRLVVGRVRARGQLAIALLTGQPRLDVVLLRGRRAEVPGGDVHHAV